MEVTAIESWLSAGSLVVLTLAIAAIIAWFGRAGVAAAPTGPTPRGWLAAGTAVLLIAFCPPFGTLAGHSLLTAHLIQVTLVMGFAPPLLLLGLPARTERQWPRWITGWARVLTHPVVAIVVVNGVFFAWHAAGPFDASLRHPGLYALQMATLLMVSLAFWWPIVGPRASSTGGMSRYQKLCYILLATIPQTFAGITVAMAGHPLYSAYTRVPREFGLSVMSDQQLAGVCMALVSKLALFAAFSVVLVRMLGDEAEGSDDGDDGGGGGGSPDLPAPVGSLTPTPGWLSLVESDQTVGEPDRTRTRSPAPVGEP